jgi:hypothetical protein
MAIGDRRGSRKVKVKVKVKVKFTLEQATRPWRGSRYMSLLFNFSAGWEWVIKATPGRFTPRK